MILLFSLALAGKLEDGWRGIPYGPASVLDTAPTSSCTRTDEPGVLWACQEDIASVPVNVFYMASDGWYHGVSINAVGFAACSTVFATLKAAWDAPWGPKEYASGSLPDGFWNLMVYQKTTSAAWTYNPYSHACSAFTMNAGISAKIDAIKKARAALAAEAL